MDRRAVIQDCIDLIRREYDRCPDCGERVIDCGEHAGTVITGGAEGPIALLEAFRDLGPSEKRRGSDAAGE